MSATMTCCQQLQPLPNVGPTIACYLGCTNQLLSVAIVIKSEEFAGLLALRHCVSWAIKLQDTLQMSIGFSCVTNFSKLGNDIRGMCEDSKQATGKLCRHEESTYKVKDRRSNCRPAFLGTLVSVARKTMLCRWTKALKGHGDFQKKP